MSRATLHLSWLTLSFDRDEMRQLARTQQTGLGSGATADAPWRLNIDQQEQQMQRDWSRMHGEGDNQGGEMDNEYSQFMDELGGKGSGSKPPRSDNPYGLPGGGPGQAGQSPYGPPGGGGGGAGAGAGRGDISDTNVYVGGLPPSYDDLDLRNLFKQFGEIVNCNVLKDKNTGLSRNFGFVHFTKPGDAYAAIQVFLCFPVRMLVH